MSLTEPPPTHATAVHPVDDPSSPPESALMTWVVRGAALVLALVTYVAYLTTMGRTVPFWDAGEFIATAKILGIPHPPGTPLYVLLGRLAVLGAEPLAVAGRVNGLSALAASGAVFFTVLGTAKVVKNLLGGRAHAAVIVLGALVAGAALGFSNEFWVNAIEAEVYALASLVVAICIWAVLSWHEAGADDDRFVLLLLYLLSLSIGIHLGTGMVLPGLLVFLALVAPRLRMTLLAMGLVVAGVSLVALAMSPFLWRQAAVGLALALAGTWLARRSDTDSRLVWAVLGGFVLGVSVHLYLIVRANVEPPPAINEADPSSWSALWDVLLRKQYPPSNIFERKAPLWFQFDRMYLHYLKEQFVFHRWHLLGVALPLALGIFGALLHLVRRSRDAAMMFTHFLVMCVVLVIYLNLAGRQHPETGAWELGEVRERAYFFVPSFQVFAMWIGAGCAGLVAAAAARAADWHPRGAAAAVGLAAVFSGLWLGGGAIARHRQLDRTDNYVARDYGYNILNFLEPDAILFTNGDNDTFPLWYLQEVEGIRRDVRVVCLSLLNTSWYIRQCRDQEPRVPIAFEDAQLENMQVVLAEDLNQLYVIDKRTQQPLGEGDVRHVAVRHIVEQNNYQRPVYFAVTVPDRSGYDAQLQMEGMVFRLLPSPASVPYDFDRMYDNVFNNYLYNGLLNEDFTRNESVVVDQTGEYLIQNYANIFVQLAFELHRRGRYDEALQMVTATRSIAPGLVQVDLLEGMILSDSGRHADAVRRFESLLDDPRTALDAAFQLGLAHAGAGELGAAARAMGQAAEMATAYTGESLSEPSLYLARILVDQGLPEDALAALDRWLATHPDDARVLAVRQGLADGNDSLLPTLGGL